MFGWTFLGLLFLMAFIGGLLGARVGRDSREVGGRD